MTQSNGPDVPNVHALTGAYVLDALDDAERAVVEAHLETCADCRTEVASFGPGVERLATVHTSTPPAGLHDAVMADVARTAQVRQPVPPAQGRAPRATRWRSAPRLAAAAAVVLLAVVTGTAVVRAQQDARLVAAEQSAVMRIVSAPDAVSHTLDLGEAHVVMSSEMGAVAVMGEDVPMPPSADDVYQVWMVHADGSAGAGPTFVPVHGEVTALVKGDLSGVTELTVTVEPRGGSTSPTGETVAEVTL